MNDIIKSACAEFISARDGMQAAFKLESAYIYPVCALLHMSAGKEADTELLKNCGALIKEKTGVFSSLRGVVRLPLISMMAVSESPEELLSGTLEMQSFFKKHFFATDYTALASAIVANHAERCDFERIALRSKAVYDLMKKEHPFLTSGEDYVFASLLAMSGLSDERIVRECECCYEILKKEFRLGNAVQTLSHVLALGDGFAEEKCKRIFELYGTLKEKGYKFGTDFELPVLGTPELLSMSAEEVADDIILADTALSVYKGYGVFGLGKRQRLMHSAMIVSTLYGREGKGNGIVGSTAATLSGAVSAVVAQQAAMLAAVSASIAASNAASH